MTGETFWAIEDDSDSEIESQNGIENEQESLSEQIEAVEAIGSPRACGGGAAVARRDPGAGPAGRGQARIADPAPQPEEAKKKKRKRRKKTGYFDTQETLTLVGARASSSASWRFLAWFFPEFRYPLGGLLAVMGAIFYLLGAMSLPGLPPMKAFSNRWRIGSFPRTSCGSC